MVLLCNKIDAMPDDLAGIEAKKMVRKRLESEVESLRVSRASGLGETDASAVRVELEIAGSNFRSCSLCFEYASTCVAALTHNLINRWSDSPLDVEFVDFSTKTGAGMDALRTWIGQL